MRTDVGAEPVNLMIPKTTSRTSCEVTQAEATVDVLSHATGACALGQGLLGRSLAGVCAILIAADRCQLETDLAARFPQAMLGVNEPIVRDDLAKVMGFVGKHAGYARYPRQRRVGEKVRAIPVGRTATYMEEAAGSAPWPGPGDRWRLRGRSNRTGPFLATASSAAMPIRRASAGASSARGKCSRRRPWHEATFIHRLFDLCGCVGGGASCRL